MIRKRKEGRIDWRMEGGRQGSKNRWIWLPYTTVLGFADVVVQLPSGVWLFATAWTAACQASLSLSISWSLPKFTSIASVILSSHLILWLPLVPLPSVFPSIRDFSSGLAVCIRWPKYWSFSFSISPSSEYSGLISPKIDWFDLLAVQGTLRSHQFFGALPSLRSRSHNHTWPPDDHSLDYMDLSWQSDVSLCFSTHCLGLA